MSFGTGKLTIILQAVDKASPAITGVKNELSGLEKEAKKNQLALAGLGVALSAAGVASLYMMNKFAHSAAELESLTKTFDNLKKGSKLSLDQLKKATGETISEIDLLRATNQALMLGIDPDALPELFEIARKSAVAMGIDATFAVESISRGIGRQSKLILDNLGIWFDVAEANEEYAATLGKTVGELTDAEKRQAYLNKALKVGTENTEKLGDITGGATEKFQQFNASMEDLKATIGEAVLPVLTPLLDALKGLFGWFESLPRPIRTFITIAGVLGGAIGVLAGTYWALSAAIHASNIAMAISQALSGPAGWAILGTAAAIAVGATIWIEKMSATKEETEEALNDMKEGVEDFVEDTESAISGMKTSEILRTKLLDAAQGIVEVFQECTEGKGEDLAENFEKSIDDLVENTNLLIKSGLLGQAQDNIAAFVDCSTSKQADMVDQIEEYLDDLYENYQDNTNKIASYRKAGWEEQARIYEEQNQAILAKMEQLETWKQQIIKEGAQRIQDIVGISTQAQIDELQKYIEYLWDLGEIGLDEATYMAAFGEKAPKIVKKTPTEPEPEIVQAPEHELTKEQKREAWKKTLDPAYLKYIEITERMLGGMAILKHKYPEYYGRGGIVTEPTFAMLGETGPEAVLPLNKLNRAFMPTHFSSNVNFYGEVHIHNEADEDRLAKKITEKQKNEIAAMWK